MVETGNVKKQVFACWSNCVDNSFIINNRCENANDEREKEDTAKNRRRARKDWRLVAITNERRNLFLYNFTKKEQVAEKIRTDAREDVIVTWHDMVRQINSHNRFDCFVRFCSRSLRIVSYRIVKSISISILALRSQLVYVRICGYDRNKRVDVIYFETRYSLYWRESLAVHDRRTKSNLITMENKGNLNGRSLKKLNFFFVKFVRKYARVYTPANLCICSRRRFCAISDSRKNWGISKLICLYYERSCSFSVTDSTHVPIHARACNRVASISF